MNSPPTTLQMTPTNSHIDHTHSYIYCCLLNESAESRATERLLSNTRISHTQKLTMKRLEEEIKNKVEKKETEEKSSDIQWQLVRTTDYNRQPTEHSASPRPPRHATPRHATPRAHSLHMDEHRRFTAVALCLLL